MKKNFQNKNNNEFSKFKNNSSSKTNIPLNQGNEKIENLLHKNKEQKGFDIDNNNNDNCNKENTKDILISLNKNSTKKVANVKDKDKFRLLIRRKEIYDSFDDEEYKEEDIDFYLDPDSWYIRIFDFFLLFSSMVYFIFVPYFLSRNYFIIKDNKIWKIILFIIDIIYIIDFLTNFFRSYKNFDENHIRKTKKIFTHYLRTWLIFDLIEAIPYFSIIKYLEKIVNEDQFGNKFIEYRTINPKLYVILLIKVIKVYKIFYSNSYSNGTVSFFSEIFRKNEFLDDHGGFIVIFFITLILINMTTCLFIFLGINAYPGWIIKLNIQDEGYLYIYLVSVYFIIVTITTVGYGDITGQDYLEIIFQIFLLIIGTIAYSFTISYISNYIIKSNKKSMTFEKHLEILQEIKLHHPEMKNSLYNEVLRNIYNEQLYEKKDKHLLIDCLPYSLKNKLISEMYKPIIRNFVFFKDIDNSDFIAKVVTSLKPLITIKGDIVIQEGDYIKEIIFVKKGVIGLNISIDLNEPDLSLKKYLCGNKIGKFDISYMKSNYGTKTNTEINFQNIYQSNNNNLNLDNNINNNNIENSTYRPKNIEEIKVIEIRSREHFGDALMFLNERCPLVAKVRTRNAELLILRKMEAIEIYSIYPNIWKRINKKSLYNMEQIYLKIKKIVIELSNRYKLNIDKLINRKKSSKNNIKKREVMRNMNKIEEQMEEEISKLSNNNNNNINHINNNNEQMILQERKENIVDFNENINQNVEVNNLERKISVKLVENMTFLKKKTTKKESLIDKMSKKELDAKILLKMSSIIKKNKSLKIFNDELTKVNTHISRSLRKSKTKNNRCNSARSNINLSKRSSYQKAHYYTNSSNLSSSKNHNLFRIKKSRTKKEKLLYNAFTNLTTTQENTFQLNSSYDNINKISNNKYIKDINLQTKIKQVLINECSPANLVKKKTAFLRLPNVDEYASKTPKSSKGSNNKLFSIFLNDTKVENNMSDLNNESPSVANSLSYGGSVKSDMNDINSNNKKTKREKLESSGKIFLQIKKSDNFASTRNIIDLRKINTPILEGRKLKRKKKPEKINKQLNIISKNIKNTSHNINNPQDFYFNLFNNIIAKEKSCVEEEGKDSGSNTLKDSNLNSIKKESVTSLKSSIVDQNSFSSGNLKDSKVNLLKTRTKRKSGFNIKIEC